MNENSFCLILAKFPFFKVLAADSTANTNQKWLLHISYTLYHKQIKTTSEILPKVFLSFPSFRITPSYHVWPAKPSIFTKTLIFSIAHAIYIYIAKACYSVDCKKGYSSRKKRESFIQINMITSNYMRGVVRDLCCIRFSMAAVHGIFPLFCFAEKKMRRQRIRGADKTFRPLPWNRLQERDFFSFICRRFLCFGRCRL